MTEQFIQDDGREHQYFHIMLNIADDELNPYQYRLLGHYRRVCGDTGTCWEGTRKTATATQMSSGKVSTTRRELAEMGYINITEPEDDTDTVKVTIADRWAENITRYRSSGERGVHGMNGVFTTRTGGVHVVNESRTPRRRTKKEDKKTLASDGARTNGKPQKPSPFNDMKEAIRLAFGWETPTPNEWAKIQKAASQLIKVEYPPADVPALYAECKSRYDTFSPLALTGVVSDVRARSIAMPPPVSRFHYELKDVDDDTP